MSGRLRCHPGDKPLISQDAQGVIQTANSQKCPSVGHADLKVNVLKLFGLVSELYGSKTYKTVIRNIQMKGYDNSCHC